MVEEEIENLEDLDEDNDSCFEEEDFEDEPEEDEEDGLCYHRQQRKKVMDASQQMLGQFLK